MIIGKSKFMLTSYGILVCAVLMCGTTLAYLVHHDIALNSFTVGSQVSEIAEVWEPPNEMQKDTDYVKNVTVKNTGTTDCYVRIFAEIMDDKMADAVTADWNDSDWTEKQPDGYYYYKSKLEPGKSTEPLFTTLTASADLAEFNMIVYEESVQAYGADSPQRAFED